MRIDFLKLYTTNLQEQVQFYSDILGLPVKRCGNNTFQVQVGYTVLEFQETAMSTPYHYAVHIPPGKEEEALAWLEQRVDILKSGEDKIVDFPNWKARSVYFYDTDKNIVELISRTDLFPEDPEKFSKESFLGVSEIGLATHDVRDAFHFMSSHFGLEKFTGDEERFCATGDDEGLFIIINKNIKDWIPTGDKAYASAFEIKFTIAKSSYEMIFNNDRLQLS